MLVRISLRTSLNELTGLRTTLCPSIWGGAKSLHLYLVSPVASGCKYTIISDVEGRIVRAGVMAQRNKLRQINPRDR